MKKKTLIIILSTLTAIIIGVTSFIAIFTLNNKPEDDIGQVDTGSLQQGQSSPTSGGSETTQDSQTPQGTQTSQSSQTSQNSQPSQESQNPQDPIEITKVYEFYDEFKVREFKQGTYRDSLSGYTLPYCIYEPKNYSPDKEYPVLLSLHGAGAMGTDNGSHITSLKNMFITSGDLVSDVIIVCPQSPVWWSVNQGYNDRKGSLGAAVRLVDNIANSYSVDEDRIYVMGISMGGYGTWEVLSYYPDKFAAGIPICGGGSTSFANILKDIPIWIYHGDADATVSVKNSDIMYDAIKSADGTKIHYTRLEGGGHNCWTDAMMDRELFSWLLCQDKSKNPSGKHSIAPYFKIIDEKGNLIINDFDTTDQYFYYYRKVNVLARFTLTDEGLKKLKKAYANGGEFTIIHGTQKLFSFRPTEVPPEHKFEIEVSFNKEN